MSNDPLIAAQRGYLYQDFATAYFFARALAEAKGSLIVNRQDFHLDRFDDLVYRDGNLFVRRQFKYSGNEARELTANDFIGNTRLRIDGLVRCHVQARPTPPDEYRLSATWRRPSDPELLKVIDPILRPPSFIGDAPACFRLKSDVIWPIGGDPVWQPLKDAGDIIRQDFVEFADRFIIELECSKTSRDFNHPGPLERLILEVLEQKVGIGRFPNNALDPRRVASELVLFAYKARTENRIVLPEDIEHELRLRKDFGRVAQQFPIDRNVYVSQDDLIQRLADLTATHRLLVLTGPPGSGKSWTLNDLADELAARGHLIAKHYCYLEPGDHEAQRRITTNVLFANLMAELIDAVPRLRDEDFPRYAAGPQELEAILPAAVQARTTGNVVLLIDGLDHIARVAAETQSLAREETDIIEELAALNLPPGVSVVIGSQPGNHLDALEHSATPDAIAHFTMLEWQPEHIAELMEHWGIGQALWRKGFEEIDEELVTTVWERSEGNPLYATYLCRMLLTAIEEAQAALPIDVVKEAPAYAGNITHYYEYLIHPLDDTAGLIANLLGVIDFGITESELREIFPLGAHRVPEALSRLAPVLKQISGQGGVRVYHESFRRFIVEHLKLQGDSVAGALAPIIDWLRQRDFYQDAKMYRFLIPCLRRANREDEILALIGPTFVSYSVAAGHPRAAVEANISVAVDIAAEREDWPVLAQCTQLMLSAYTCFEEKFDTELFGKTFCELHGVDALADRLLFDGRPTMPRIRGLRLCTLCDTAGGAAPWQEYLDLLPEPEENQNDDSGHQAILDTIQGKLRLNGIDETYRRIGDWLSSTDDPDEGFTRSALRTITKAGGSEVLDRMLGEFSLTERAAVLVAIERAWACREAGDTAGAQTQASDLAHYHLSAALAYECLQLGCDPAPLEDYVSQLHATSPGVTGLHGRPEGYTMTEWVALVSIAAQIAPDSLSPIAAGIEGEGWYRDWLRYIITLAQAEVKVISDPVGAEEDIVQALRDVAVDTKPFKGQPRACDLYSIWDHVHSSIARGLRLLRTPNTWAEALDLLVQISEGTTTTLSNSPGGPLTSSALMELLVPYYSDQALNETISRVIEDQLQRAERNGEYYENHAEHEMRLAWCMARGQHQVDALVHWNRAATYLAGYGFHKDISLFDFIECTPLLAQTNRELAIAALIRIQPLTDIAVNHTDGRETKHLQNAWFRSLCDVDLAGGLVLLARTLALDGGRHLWKLESAAEDAVQMCRGKTDPLPLNFAQMTFRSDEDTRDGEGKAYTIDTLLQQDLRLGEQVLRVLAAQVSCDDVGASDATYGLLEQVAAQHSIVLPPRTTISPTATSQHDPVMPRVTSRNYMVHSPPLFPAEATPLEILAALRNAPKQYYASDDNYTHLLNALGYRLVTLIEAGAEHEAVRIVRYLAREYHFSTGAHLLADLASGLERHRHLRVAAIAWTLAYIYSRGGGGYLLMGGKDFIHWFQHSVRLSPSDAWQTLALEIANLLHHGRAHGITRHLAELCATELTAETGYAVWDAAFEVMVHRLPEPNADYHLFLTYSPTGSTEWSVIEALVYLVVCRITHPEFQRKVTALTGLVTLISQTPEVAIRPLRCALNLDTPLSSCVLILQSLWEAEPSLFPITRALVPELQAFSQCGHFSIETIARNLLERSGEKVQNGFVDIERAITISVDQAREEHILSLDWADRVEHIRELWPAFPALVAARFEELWLSGITQERGYNRHKVAYSNSGRQIPPTSLLFWEDEIFECAFQEVLAGLRLELWRTGEWRSDIEEQILRHVVPDMHLHVRAWYSRTVRPPMLLPIELQERISSVLPIGVGDEYMGWYRCGYYEQQYLMNREEYGTVTGVRRVVQGIVCLQDGEVPEVVLPTVNTRAAWEPATSAAPSALLPVFGPIAGLNLIEDNLGGMAVLAFLPVLARRFGLHAASQLGPLELVDTQQRKAVVFRRWSARPFGRAIDEETPQLCGCDLLMRPDLYNRLISITPNSPIEVTKVIPMAWSP